MPDTTTDTTVIHAQHHYDAPLVFSVETDHENRGPRSDGDAPYDIQGEVIIRAPGVIGNMTPISRMPFEYEVDSLCFRDPETGESYAHAHSMVRALLYTEDANRKEIRLAAGLMEIACNPRRCFRLVDGVVASHAGQANWSEFGRCVAVASIALSCTDQQNIEETFGWYRLREQQDTHEEVAPCEHVQPGDDPCSSCLESYSDPQGRCQ